MPFRWPTDPPGKPPSHSLPWQVHQANLFNQHQEGATAGAQHAAMAARVAPGPAAPAIPAPAMPAAPAAPSDPRDAEYTGSLGELIAKRKEDLAGIGRERAYATQDRDDALRQLTQGRTQTLLNGKRDANNRGLFYSTFLTKGNRDTNKNYDDQQTGVQRSFKQGEDDRIAREASDKRLYGTDDKNFGSEGARLLREAIQRALQRQLGLAA